MDWKTLWTCVAGSVDEGLLLRHEYLATENRTLRNRTEGCVYPPNAERRPSAEIGLDTLMKPS